MWTNGLQNTLIHIDFIMFVDEQTSVNVISDTDQLSFARTTEYA